MKRDPLLLGVIIFFISIIISALVSLKSTPASIVIAVCGLILTIIIIFHKPLDTKIKKNGYFRFIAPGFDVTLWTARVDNPIRTVIPDHPTDTTTNEEAKKLCQEGRDLVAPKATGKEANLNLAFEKFYTAYKLDTNYWEPRINIAQILLIWGQLDRAYGWAADVRTNFSEIKAAFVKAGLIMAEIMERRIDPKMSKESLQSEFKKIATILEDSLKKDPEHLTTRYSLGRVLLLCGVDKKIIEDFLMESIKYKDFRERFRDILQSTGLKNMFKKDFPNFPEN
jgi:hypothetical protein